MQKNVKQLCGFMVALWGGGWGLFSCSLAEKKELLNMSEFIRYTNYHERRSLTESCMASLYDDLSLGIWESCDGCQKKLNSEYHQEEHERLAKENMSVVELQRVYCGIWNKHASVAFCLTLNLSKNSISDNGYDQGIQVKCRLIESIALSEVKMDKLLRECVVELSRYIKRCWRE